MQRELGVMLLAFSFLVVGAFAAPYAETGGTINSGDPLTGYINATGTVANYSTGQACVSNTQCISGHCSDGYCCDSACSGTCNRCNVTGSEGTCTNLNSLCGGIKSSCYCSAGSCIACTGSQVCTAYQCKSSGSTGGGDTGGDTGGGSTDTGGGGAAGPPPKPKYNITFNLSDISEDAIQNLIEKSENVQKALEEAGFDTSDAGTVAKIAEASKKAYEYCTAVMEVTHPDVMSTQVDVKLNCTGKITMKDVVVFIELPKSFAASSDDITVTAHSQATVVIIESDPVYSFEHSLLTLDKAYYEFFTPYYVNRDTVADDWKQPWFFTEEVIKYISPNCGDNMRDEGEECDGSDVPAGYKCTDECKLEKLPVVTKCVDDGVCTPVEKALGNCFDCRDQCVDDGVCTPEEERMGCADCLVPPIVLPEEVAMVLDFMKASAGTILLLIALTLAVILFRMWRKKRNKKTHKSLKDFWK